jgi:hypothetical protein
MANVAEEHEVAAVGNKLDARVLVATEYDMLSIVEKKYREVGAGTLAWETIRGLDMQTPMTPAAMVLWLQELVDAGFLFCASEIVAPYIGTRFYLSRKGGHALADNKVSAYALVDECEWCEGFGCAQCEYGIKQRFN